MSNSPFRRVKEFLKNDSAGATNLIDQIQVINSKLWAEITGDLISSHTHVILQGREAIVYADSAVWAHSVNQQRITFLQAMRDKGLIIDSIQVRNQLREPQRSNKSAERKPAAIPPNAARILEQTAITVHDKELQLALLKLSRFGNNTSD